MPHRIIKKLIRQLLTQFHLVATFCIINHNTTTDKHIIVAFGGNVASRQQNDVTDQNQLSEMTCFCIAGNSWEFIPDCQHALLKRKLKDKIHDVRYLFDRQEYNITGHLLFLVEALLLEIGQLWSVAVASHPNNLLMLAGLVHDPICLVHNHVRAF